MKPIKSFLSDNFSSQWLLILFLSHFPLADGWWGAKVSLIFKINTLCTVTKGSFGLFPKILRIYIIVSKGVMLCLGLNRGRVFLVCWHYMPKRKSKHKEYLNRLTLWALTWNNTSNIDLWSSRCVLIQDELYVQVNRHIVEVIDTIQEEKMLKCGWSAGVFISEVFERKHSVLHQPLVS